MVSGGPLVTGTGVSSSRSLPEPTGLLPARARASVLCVRACCAVRCYASELCARKPSLPCAEQQLIGHLGIEPPPTGGTRDQALRTSEVHQGGALVRPRKGARARFGSGWLRASPHGSASGAGLRGVRRRFPGIRRRKRNSSVAGEPPTFFSDLSFFSFLSALGVLAMMLAAADRCVDRHTGQHEISFLRTNNKKRAPTTEQTGLDGECSWGGRGRG